MENSEYKTETANTGSVVEPNKTIAILAYITLIGWIVAVVMNNEKKDDFASFHIRQMLGIGCTSLVLAALNVVPILGWTAYVLGMVFLLIPMDFRFNKCSNRKRKTCSAIGN